MTLEGFKEGVAIVNGQWVSVLQNEGAERLTQGDGSAEMPKTWHRQPDLGARQDWHLMDDGRVVGRVYEDPVKPGVFRWFKHPIPAQSGSAGSLKEAQTALEKVM